MTLLGRDQPKLAPEVVFSEFGIQVRRVFAAEHRIPSPDILAGIRIGYCCCNGAVAVNGLAPNHGPDYFMEHGQGWNARTRLIRSVLREIGL